MPSTLKLGGIYQTPQGHIGYAVGGQFHSDDGTIDVKLCLTVLMINSEHKDLHYKTGHELYWEGKLHDLTDLHSQALIQAAH